MQIESKILNWNTYLTFQQNFYSHEKYPCFKLVTACTMLLEFNRYKFDDDTHIALVTVVITITVYKIHLIASKTITLFSVIANLK